MDQRNKSDLHRKVRLGLKALHRPLVVALSAVSESIGRPVERRELDAHGRRHCERCEGGAVVLEHELYELDAKSPPHVLGDADQKQVVDLLTCERKASQRQRLEARRGRDRNNSQSDLAAPRSYNSSAVEATSTLPPPPLLKFLPPAISSMRHSHKLQLSSLPIVVVRRGGGRRAGGTAPLEPFVVGAEEGARRGTGRGGGAVDVTIGG